ncbi:MAG: iron-sulfur cluster repair di-iron protein [Planctomycetes bacterium]|nr:iron-sulfur cluster repair di-iron protein [Planctomycetota bacterium]
MTEPADAPGSSPRITAESILAELATAWAGASRVFLRHGLDFCCKGRMSVGAACAQKGLDTTRVLAELRAELEPLPDDERWDERPVVQLLAHLVDHFHAGHRAELPRLLAMAAKVETVHGSKADCPRGLAAHLLQMQQELEEHMQKEEEVLFPALLAGHDAQVAETIVVLEREHDEHGDSLSAMRRLAHDLVPPPAACGTWRALYLGLGELERDLMQHVHLENHVLFPRCLSR